MVIAYVGSGGKTTLLKQHAQEYRKQGLKVFATTSTRMFREDALVCDDAQAIIEGMQRTGYVFAGSDCGEKIGPLSPSVYREVCSHADVVLVEADGSKHMPIKFPAEHEPVIWDNVEKIIVVCGMHALGKPAREVCHRLELVKQCLGIEDETIITAEHILQLLLQGYILPLGKRYPEKEINVYLRRNESDLHTYAAAFIQKHAQCAVFYC